MYFFKLLQEDKTHELPFGLYVFLIVLPCGAALLLLVVALIVLWKNGAIRCGRYQSVRLHESVAGDKEMGSVQALGIENLNAEVPLRAVQN